MRIHLYVIVSLFLYFMIISFTKIGGKSMFENLKKTPLYNTYNEYGGKMVEFGGWAMPVQYRG